jgi:hypothetical protein
VAIGAGCAIQLISVAAVVLPLLARARRRFLARHQRDAGHLRDHQRSFSLITNSCG